MAVLEVLRVLVTGSNIRKMVSLVDPRIARHLHFGLLCTSVD